EVHFTKGSREVRIAEDRCVPRRPTSCARLSGISRFRPIRPRRCRPVPLPRSRISSPTPAPEKLSLAVLAQVYPTPAATRRPGVFSPVCRLAEFVDGSFVGLVYEAGGRLMGAMPLPMRAILALVSCAISVAGVAVAATPARPNILLLLADDWGSPHASILGDA